MPFVINVVTNEHFVPREVQHLVQINPRDDFFSELGPENNCSGESHVSNEGLDSVVQASAEWLLSDTVGRHTTSRWVGEWRSY